MSKHPFTWPEHVRWSDVDFAGIMRWDAYSRLCEIGEAELFRSFGHPLNEVYADVWLPRKLAHAEYFAPARLDDRVQIRVYFSSIGRTSVTINYEVWSDDGRTLHAAMHQVLVSVRRSDFVKTDLPASLKEAMAPWLMSVEDARAAPATM